MVCSPCRRKVSTRNGGQILHGKRGQGEWADIARNVNVAGKPPIGVAALVHETAHRGSIVHAVSVRSCGVTADHAGTCKNVHRVKFTLGKRGRESVGGDRVGMTADKLYRRSPASRRPSAGRGGSYAGNTPRPDPPRLCVKEGEKSSEGPGSCRRC